MSTDFADWTNGITIITGSTPVTADFPDWTEAIQVASGPSPGGYPDFTGTGSPEGVQIATPGKTYEDTSTGVIWQKRFNTDATGWGFEADSGTGGIALSDSNGGNIGITSSGNIVVSCNGGPLQLQTGSDQAVWINPGTVSANADIWLQPTNNAIGTNNQVKLVSTDSILSSGFLLVQAGHTGGVPGSDPTLAIEADGLLIQTPVDTANDSGINIHDTGTSGIGVVVQSDHGQVHIAGGGGAMFLAGNNQLGFYGHTPASRPTVTGSRGGNAALASLLTGLAGLGLIVDSSTP